MQNTVFAKEKNNLKGLFRRSRSSFFEFKINISETKVKQRRNKSMVLLQYQIKQNKSREGDQKHGKIKVSKSK